MKITDQRLAELIANANWPGGTGETLAALVELQSRRAADRNWLQKMAAAEDEAGSVNVGSPEDVLSVAVRAEIFIAEYADGSLLDDTGDGGWSCWWTRAEAQDAADNDPDNPSRVIRYIRSSESAAPAVGREWRAVHGDGHAVKCIGVETPQSWVAAYPDVYRLQWRTPAGPWTDVETPRDK